MTHVGNGKGERQGGLPSSINVLTRRRVVDVAFFCSAFVQNVTYYSRSILRAGRCCIPGQFCRCKQPHSGLFYFCCSLISEFILALTPFQFPLWQLIRVSSCRPLEILVFVFPVRPCGHRSLSVLHFSKLLFAAREGSAHVQLFVLFSVFSFILVLI